MSVETATGDFIIIGLNTAEPKYYWKGQRLTDVILCKVVKDNLDGGDADDDVVKLKVLNNSAFDSVYAEMSAAGIQVKKVNG